ncbi:MAG: M3 family metallopeptidase [Oceanipulchritudo sp.]
MDWDLDSYFSEFGSPTYVAFREDLKDEMETLSRRTGELLASPEVATFKQWETLLIDFEGLEARFSHIASYLGCLAAADARNDAYLKEENAFAEFEAMLAKLRDKILRGLGGMDRETFENLVTRDRMEDAAYPLAEMRRLAKKRMPAELEALAADLGVHGISAWSRLYFTAVGNLKFRYTDPGKGETEVPISHYNSLMCDPNRQRRIAVQEGAARSHAEHQQTYAAALNAISGARHLLNRRRGIDEFLEPSLRQSRIRQTTLDALMTAVEDRLPFAREVFRFRTESMGISDPGYVDLRAPLSLSEESGPDWASGTSLISAAFNSTYPALGVFFDEMVDKRWIDHTPREGKRPGGFCTTSLATRESRIFMNYKDTLNDVLTLAHETGHAWHSRVMKDQRVLATHYPMTLAETASTFAERILTEGILGDDDVDKAVKLVLLDAEVEHMLAFLLDLPVRFRFEREVYERRKEGTLSPTEFCNLMTITQRNVFGDTLAEGREDPWFWASKLHFYIDGVEFYNYPYTFGYLLSTAFMQRFREEGNSALNIYERFLANSGKMNCEDAVKESLNEDIGDPNFWAAQIDALRRPFTIYKDMLQELAG